MEIPRKVGIPLMCQFSMLIVPPLSNNNNRIYHRNLLFDIVDLPGMQFYFKIVDFTFTYFRIIVFFIGLHFSFDIPGDQKDF